jgi:hypothetical protein
MKGKNPGLKGPQIRGYVPQKVLIQGESLSKQGFWKMRE